MLKRITLASSLIFTNLSYANDANLTFTTGIDYSSGKYGQSEKTNITYVPITSKYEIDDLTLKLTIPWLTIEGPGGVTGEGINITPTNSSSKITRASGLGDIVAGITYSALQFDTQKIYIDVGAKVKIPTASEKKSLGTGEYDYTLITDIYKTINNFTLLGTVGYKVLGDSATINLDDVWFGTVGAVYKLNKNNSAGLTLDLRQPTSKSSTSLREYTAFYSHKFDDTYKLQVYLVTGDTTSSTDFGAGAMLGINW